jgi:hypothetical protein
VYCCAWRLETPDDVLVYGEDDRSRLETVLPLLEGRLVLRLMPIHAETYEHWFLYAPEGVLVFGPGTNWEFEAA